MIVRHAKTHIESNGEKPLRVTQRFPLLRFDSLCAYTPRIEYTPMAYTSDASSSFQGVDLNSLGCAKLNDDVYELYKPDPGDIDVEIVFFHGFHAASCEDAFVRTWMTSDGSACWLNTWLVECFPQARILSVSYDASTRVSDSRGRLDMYQTRENLAISLIELSDVGQNCLVILVGHCVGGLVLKEICLRAASICALELHTEGARHRQFLGNMRGAFFYATGHLGSPLSVRLSTHEGGRLLEYFHELNQKSARINGEFAQLRHLHGWETFGANAANETRTSMISALADDESMLSVESSVSSDREYSLVVGEASGRIDVDRFTTVSGVDHFTISTPRDRRSNNFLLLVRFIRDILRAEEFEEHDAGLQRHLQLPPKLIETPQRMNEALEFLDLDNSQSVRMSLVGIDGIGKSTLAKQVFLRIGSQFDYACFLEFEDISPEPCFRDIEKLVEDNLFRGRKFSSQNPRRGTRNNPDPEGTQNNPKATWEKLVTKDVSQKPMMTASWENTFGRRMDTRPSRQKTLWSLAQGKKMLIIIDDVEDKHQILPILKSDWWRSGKGNRMIITTRVKQVIPSWEYQFIEYDVPTLSEWESTELFISHINPLLLGVIPDKLVSEIVDQCDGLPIALEVLGCYLSRQKEVRLEVWKDALRRLQTCDDALEGRDENRVWHKLKIAFDRLGRVEKGIFLDLAAFDAYGPEKARYDLDIFKSAWTTGLTRGESGELAIENLRDMCFVRIAPGTNHIVQSRTGGNSKTFHKIHKVLRNMGLFLSGLDAHSAKRHTSLVCCSRLSEDNLVTLKRLLKNVKDEDDEDEVVQTLSLMMAPCESSSSSHKTIKWSLLNRLAALRLLRMSNINMTDCHDVFTLPRSLSMLHMIDCWGPQITLSEGEHFSGWPIREENIEYLRGLSVLLLQTCSPIRLPSNFYLLRNLRILHIHDKSINNDMELPETFGLLPALEVFTLNAPVKQLPVSLLELSLLRRMEIRNSPFLQMWPTSTTSNLASLTTLELTNLSCLIELPESFGRMESLERLSVEACSVLKRLPEGFSSLRFLSIVGCQELEILCESIHSLRKLEELRLFSLPALRMLPNDLGLLASLQLLYIRDCSTLAKLPQSFQYNKSLIDLRIGRCSSLVSLWRDPTLSRELDLNPSPWEALTTLSLFELPQLAQLPESIDVLTELRQLEITGCDNLRRLPEALGWLNSLQVLKLVRCRSLITMPHSLGYLLKLKSLRVHDCPEISSLPKTLGNMKSLERLELEWCYGFELLSKKCLGGLILLQVLKLEGCSSILELPESLGNLPSLKSLVVASCHKFRALPHTLGNLRSLEHLQLESCGEFHILPHSWGKLRSLKELTLKDCPRLSHIPHQSCQFPLLRSLRLEGLAIPQLPFELRTEHDDLGLCLPSLTSLSIDCGQIRVLPESLGQLSSLRELRIKYRRDRPLQLPKSIGNLKSLVRLDLDSDHWEYYEGDLPPFALSPGQMPNLRELRLHFTHPKILRGSHQPFKALQSLCLKLGFPYYESAKLVDLPEYLQEMGDLETLCFDCPEIMTTDIFQFLHALRCPRLRVLELVDDFRTGVPAESLGQLSQIQSLSISLSSIVALPTSLGQLKALDYLSIIRCEKLCALPESIGQLRSLSELTIINCIKRLPRSLGQLSNLSYLRIESCHSLEELPLSLGQLRALSTLELSCCGVLKSLPESTGGLQSLRRLMVTLCENFEKLPMSVEFGNFKQLRIGIEGCRRFVGFSHRRWWNSGQSPDIYDYELC